MTDFKRAFTDAASDVADEYYPKGKSKLRGAFLRDQALILVKLLDNLKEESAIGAKMAEQNNRSTQYPMFVIMTDKKIYMPHSYAWDYDGKERLDDEYQEIDVKDLCKKCAELYNEDFDYSVLPDDCEDCDPEAFKWYKKEEQIEQLPGVFFTAEAAQRHIDENHYHYNNPRVYGIGAWRNEEMQTVQRLLIGLALKDLPSHYR